MKLSEVLIDHPHPCSMWIADNWFLPRTSQQHRDPHRRWHCNNSWQENQLRHRNAPWSAATCDVWFLPHCLLYLHIIRKRNRSIGAMKYIQMLTNILDCVDVALILFFVRRRPTSANLWSAALSVWPWRILMSAIYHIPRSIWDSRSPTWAKTWWGRRCHCTVLASLLLLILMDGAISQTRSIALLLFHCVVKRRISCWIAMLSTARWLTSTQVFSDQRQTYWDCSWIVLAYRITDFGHQMPTHHISGPQQWSRIQQWLSNIIYTKQELGFSNIPLWVMRCDSGGEEDVSKVLEIINMVARQCKSIWGHGGVFLIWWHHLGCDSASRNQFAWHYLGALICWLNATFTTNTTRSILYSHTSLIWTCSSPCTPRWYDWLGD